jgi:serine/threonine protein kinase
MTEEFARSSAAATVGGESGTRTAANSGRPEAIAEWRGSERYQVLRRIGEGGMGVVYEAFDRDRGQAVAVKSLLYFTPAALYRFKQEFRTLADVHHQNLVRLHELVVTEGAAAFFVMELVGGSDFQAYVQRVIDEPPPAALPPRATVKPGSGAVTSAHPTLKPSPADFDKLRRALRQLVEGVQALHSAGKLHRDIKPSNILVTPEGRVVILDFGVATELARVVDQNLSEEPEVVGTVRYMSPEQAVADEPTTASDWYSVGVVLYEALAGRPPFVGTSFEVLTMKTSGEPIPPCECVTGVPEELDSLCRALLDRDPEKRPTGPEILRRLGATRSFRPIPSLPPAAEGGKAPTLVGRETHLRALRDAFEQVLAGRSMTVRVAGASGMGKSAVAQHFLDGLVERGEAVVLRGRTYERESLPFKAFDTVIDALSRYLIHLEGEANEITLPEDIGALARVFPVLRRVPGIADIPEIEVTDPQRVRRQAFSALRALLGELARLQPLVIYIDDVHWGDTDSAALLLELTRPPNAPAVLFVLTNRDNQIHSSPFLKELHERWPGAAESRDVDVGPLAPADAQQLARTLLEANDERALKTARAVARESRGTPFLIEELVRSNRGESSRGDPTAPSLTLAVLSLEQMVGERLERLTDGARLLLELVAVGGRPVPVSLVAQASSIGAGLEEAINLGRSRRLLRTGLRDGRDVIETTNDRFCEIIVAQLSADKVRAHHASLAAVLEAAPVIDTEAIAVHLFGAGENVRAAKYAHRAAEEAVTKFAFDQAARLFRLTLEMAPAPPDETRRMKTRLAQVLEWSGRAEEAARAYLEAAEGAPPIERAELERAASVGLLASGRIVEGAEVLRRALAAVGLKTPGSVLSMVFWLIAYTIRLALWSIFGQHVEERDSESISREEHVRINSIFAGAIGFACTDVLLGACMSRRSLVAALHGGDRFQILRAALLVASNHAGLDRTPGKIERALVDLATRLTEKDGSDAARSFFQGNLGASVYLRGEWQKARTMLEVPAAGAQNHDLRAGWLSNAKVFACWSLNFLGEHRELARRHALLLEEADQVGDRYMSVQLRDGSLAIMWLVADDPEGGRRDVKAAMDLWPTDRYLLQHWHQMYGEGEIELYAGEPAKAYARVERDMPALKKSLILRIQHMRAQTMFLRGRAAAALLDVEPARKRELLVETRSLAAQLEKEGMAWIAPFAAILTAAAANADGDRPGAIAGLKSAIDLARAADMSGYATAARYQLGTLLGGDEGNQLVKDAEEAMKAQGIRVPNRFAATLVPGRWQSA